MNIKRLFQLDNVIQLEQAKALIRETEELHWMHECPGEVLNCCLAPADFLTADLVGTMPVFCLIHEGIVISILVFAWTKYTSGPLRGVVVRTLLWSCTDSRFRHQGITYKFHKSIIKGCAKFGNHKHITIDTDAWNAPAVTLAKRLMKDFPGFVRVLNRDKVNGVVHALMIKNGKEVEYYQEPAT